MAMQRATAVTLGELGLWGTFDHQKPLLAAVGGRALAIRKFRERLGQVPAFLSTGWRPGLGLNAFNFAVDMRNRKSEMEVARGEVLLSLASSDFFDDFANFGIGLNLDRVVNDELSDEVLWLIGLPISAEGLLTLSNTRELQLRAAAELIPLRGEYSSYRHIRAAASIEWLMGTFRGAEWQLNLSLEQMQTAKWHSPLTKRSSQAMLEVEVHRF
jgi:hypothetical protein